MSPTKLQTDGWKTFCAIALILVALTGRADESWQTNYAAFGKLLVASFATAPFPHGARTAGFARGGKTFATAEHYSDSTVALFVPNNFRPADQVDFVIHFHGWNNTVAGTLEQFNLVRQFCDSGKNAVLIVPEGPHNAPDSFGGKLEDTNGFKMFMTEAMEKLRQSGVFSERGLQPASTSIGKATSKRPEGRAPSIGNVILSGHSGGYHVMAGIVDRGGVPIKEAWLFDALYGNTENFVAWQKREGGRMVNIYTDHGGTKDESEKLMASYKTDGVSFVSLEETNSATPDLAKSKIVFIHTDLTHNEVIFRRGEFSQFLQTSCLQVK